MTNHSPLPLIAATPRAGAAIPAVDFPADQLYRVAQVFCAETPASIVDHAALVAAASVCGAKLHGVPLFPTPDEAAAALAETLLKLTPLSQDNALFAKLAAAVYLRRASDFAARDTPTG
ncbi:hypothetical protein ACFPVT_03070 [Corynebacterium choanae]|nr:hypothetical protein [Corynebacterium choanae]